MDKSTYRVLVVLLLGVIVFFIVIDRLKMFSFNADESTKTQDVEVTEVDSSVALLPEKTKDPIGFRYNDTESTDSL